MPAGPPSAGVGIGPPAPATQPNGLGVSDAVGVTLVSADGTPLVTAAPLPRMVLGGFTFVLNPRDSLTVSEPPLLALHLPPGGTPRYQFMGRDETRLHFRGTLSGDTALTDLAALRALSGTRQSWSFGPLSAAQAWVRVDWTYNRDDDVDYDIQLAIEEVIALNASAGSGGPPAQAEGQAATPPPAAPTTATVAYTVRQGDTLYSIAQAELGDGGLFAVIARLNEIDDPRSLTVHQVLQLPADHASAVALRGRQEEALAGYPRDGATGVPAAAA